ncbi:BnaC05g26110D [Brassica napus]|uniref:BnaC05g26110D protein n=1 Tax=Brassica napus TaxID=3708 RepID=A0A078G5Z0_BRANA|nr:BnaC05g26110D [Brassica napus]
MQSAIIKAVTDSIGIPKPSGVSFGEPSGVDIRKELPPIGINNPVQPNPNNNTPSELADSRINEVLVELNGLSDAHQATVQEKELLVPVNTSVDKLQSAVEGNNAVDQVLNDTISVDSTPSDPTSEELEMDEMQIPYYLLDMPSFSLGLSQEDAPVAATEKITPLSYVSPAKEPIEEAPELRKSKSSRIMPDGLQDYKCDLKVTENLPLIPDLEVRFKLMEETVLNGPVVILRNGYGVTPGEICDIAHRSSSLPSWVSNVRSQVTIPFYVFG